jgi:hypothetical protein
MGRAYFTTTEITYLSSLGEVYRRAFPKVRRLRVGTDQYRTNISIALSQRYPQQVPGGSEVKPK